MLLAAYIALAMAAAAGWEYNTSWTADNKLGLDEAARRVAPDVFDLFGDRGYGPPYDGRFANPCWRNATSGELRCLPALYILGGFQCGAADLTKRLLAASNLALGLKPSSDFWIRGSEWRLESFVTQVVGTAVPAIEAAPATKLTLISSLAMLTFTWSANRRVHGSYHRAFSECAKPCRRERPPEAHSAACASRTYRMDHCYRHAWASDPAGPLRPLGQELTLPRLMVRAHGDRLRVVALLRNPCDRVWSAYFTYSQFPRRYGDSEAGVARYFRNMSSALAACARAHGMRACATRFKALGHRWSKVFYGADQVIKGLYSVFVEEWLDALGPGGAHFELSEDFFQSGPNRRAALARVCAFAGLRVSGAELYAMASGAHRAHGRSRGWRPAWQMSAALRAEMGRFYEPYNRALGSLLGEPRCAEWPVFRQAEPRAAR
jgi:hypothetical protein